MSIRGSIIAVANLFKNKDLQKIVKEDLTSVVAATMSNDPAAEVTSIKKTITDVVHFPTYIFWSKMEMYLRGTFHSFEDQVKLASRFEPNSEDYVKFVGKLIATVDQIEDVEKINFYANLTRAFLLECIDKAMFFKLSKFLLLLTYDELLFLRNCPYEYAEPNSVMISALYQYGLFGQGETINKVTRYKLSVFAIALKQNCLNFDRELYGMKRIGKYEEIDPLSLPKPLTWGDISTEGETLVLDGGNAVDR